MTQEYEVTVGLPIFTPSGERLGEVRAIDGHFLQVRAEPSEQLDYWLSIPDAVSQVSGDRITVSFEREDLEENKAGTPSG